MKIKYNINIEEEVIKANFHRLTNQIYKLLPIREEGGDWEKPLITILEELGGMNELFLSHFPILLTLLCKLEGLFLLKNDKDFMIFRKTIFESLELINELGGLICH